MGSDGRRIRERAGSSDQRIAVVTLVTGDCKETKMADGPGVAEASGFGRRQAGRGQGYIVDLGLIGYGDASALQKRMVACRKAGAIGDVLLLCEHPHVITQGRNGKRSHLLAGEHVLGQKGVEYFETSRGGDITYHGPGQIVGYPILQLGAIRRDVVWYVRMLEEVMIRTTAEFGLPAAREHGKTGVWVAANQAPSGDAPPSAPQKIGAIGVHISRWVTSHGFAYNVSTDLRFFDLIVPCGIAGRKATSLEKLLGRAVDPQAVKPVLARHFGEVFGLALQPASAAELQRQLECFERTPLAISA
jgi:lipoyl(octanoyl) transferase